LGDARSSWRSARAAAPPPPARSPPPCCSARARRGRARQRCQPSQRAQLSPQGRTSKTTPAGTRPARTRAQRQRRVSPLPRRSDVARACVSARPAPPSAPRVSWGTRLPEPGTTRGTALSTACPGRLRGHARAAGVSNAGKAPTSKKRAQQSAARTRKQPHGGRDARSRSRSTDAAARTRRPERARKCWRLPRQQNARPSHYGGV
jgi:hypothetical protein